MQEDIRVKQNKRIRGQIMSLLRKVYPNGIEMRVLANILVDSHFLTNTDIAPYAAYLIEKKYVTTIPPEELEKILHGMFKTSLFLKLTTKGVDLADGLTEDVGVDV